MKLFAAFLILTAGLVVSSAAVSAQEAQDSTASADADKYWGTDCSGPSRNADALACTATQSIFVTETKQLLFRIKVITPANKGDPVMELQGPLNFYLPGGFTLSVDGTDLAKVTVSNCNQSGCYGAVKLEAGMLDALKRGSNLRITFLSAPQKSQFVETPLAGFTRALQAIQ